MKDSPGIHLPPPFLFIVALAAGVVVDGNLLQWRHVFHASQWAGVVVAVIGLALIGGTLALFWRFRTRPEPWEPAANLIEVGPYRLSRNPMYLGMAVTTLGAALLFESIVAVALLALVVLIIDRWVIAREEAY
ncbi:MAG: isoprenylcysteine carboxylmethyltransferase family protein, partial [Hyphomicrobiaceae bacterium]